MNSDLSLESIINSVLIIVGFSITVFFLWRTKSVSVYKDAVGAYEVRLKQIEQNVTDLTAENKELRDKYNQLIGENKTLKLVNPSPLFEKTVTSIQEVQSKILDVIKTLQENNIKHGKQDDDRFALFGEYVKNGSEVSKANHGILERIANEQFSSRPASSGMAKPISETV